METGSAINGHLAVRLRDLRTESGMTMDGLSERTGVSRSMISLIERGESSPTAAVLDKLAAGLGVTLASLFAEKDSAGASPLARRADQRVWRDPDSGYMRRNLSPAGFPSPIELVEVVLPPGARVAYDTGHRASPVHQQIWIIEGEIALTLGDETHHLATGDCLSMRLDRPTVFRNHSDRPARYVVALATDARAGAGIQRRGDL
ncbi:helix-turn-helix transcriptional regulator [Microvirga sp. 3-52]|jgi:transcriptional regulator with XRE-family HTH domain|uniref:helix-turn-helix domain-containing protein n=1 Tax=Microvirga sp. 3-52 TaxID=2792425 RepID=UPI001AD0C6AD|nr:XRE family transcriptional regulator [Microvirga sp. 3-52]MBO1904224.1 helix-turn-helix transcriptional regulator [Microvirga sp. 3-52]MBS7451832.1 helix-turn-helix transcriptional regulator [Microvirga sp. 3-52]